MTLDIDNSNGRGVVECDTESGSRRITDLEASGKNSFILSGRCSYLGCGVLPLQRDELYCLGIVCPPFPRQWAPLKLEPCKFLLVDTPLLA